jgi:hypothetical protein
MCLALADIADGAHSLLEIGYVRDVERPHGLPAARRQAKRRGNHGRVIYLDNFLEQFGLCVELDGQAAHPASRRWRDIERDNAAAASGIITLRYGWADITQRPCLTAAQIAATLRQRGWTGQPSPCNPCCPVKIPY